MHLKLKKYEHDLIFRCSIGPALGCTHGCSWVLLLPSPKCNQDLRSGRKLTSAPDRTPIFADVNPPINPPQPYAEAAHALTNLLSASRTYRRCASRTYRRCASRTYCRCASRTYRRCASRTYRRCASRTYRRCASRANLLSLRLACPPVSVVAAPVPFVQFDTIFLPVFITPKRSCR